jgi:hypothetical protein
MERKFELGQRLMTPGFQALFPNPVIASYAASVFLARHVQGDWGDVGDEDGKANDHDLVNEGRLLSIYHVNLQTRREKIYIITEWDRSRTTILLPEEY